MNEPGYPFMFGIYGTRASRRTVSLLKETGACGVLLLARNIETPAQVRRLTRELQERVGRPLLFSVDHEGGWVLRFRGGLTAFPGNASLGRAGDPRPAYEVGARMARELRGLGIRMNLAPVVDVVTSRYNPGIGIRSFGRDPALAGRLGAAFTRGLQDNGVSACAKHFPGKGAATADAHRTLPTIRLPAREFYRRHLRPFADAVRAGVDCVMTSHVDFPALDPARTPATFSRRITRGLLRRRLGFEGVVVSDDLCMGAITERWPIQEAAVSAMAAGHDILLIAHAAETQREAVGLFAAALAEGRASREEFGLACARVRALERRRRDCAADRPIGGSPQAVALARRIARAAVELVQKGSVVTPLGLGPGGARRLAVVWPDFAEVKQLFTFEGGAAGPLRRLRARLARWPARSTVSLAPIHDSASRAARAAAAARGADLVVFFCFEAMRFGGQRKTLELLQRCVARKLVVCLIRNPWDRQLLKPGVTALDGYGYRDCSIDALLEVLRPS